jgi:hypothetical protein
LPQLWPFWNANTTLKWLTVGAWVLGFVTFGLPGLALAIYIGINGNRIAARDRSFASVDQFVAVQRAWARAGIIVFVVLIPLVVILSVLSAIVSSLH